MKACAGIAAAVIVCAETSPVWAQSLAIGVAPLTSSEPLYEAFDSTTQTHGPLTDAWSITQNFGNGAIGQTSGEISVDYGSLFISDTGSGHTAGGNGAGASITGSIAFSDTLTVGSATLAAGAPVQVGFDISFDGSTSGNASISAWYYVREGDDVFPIDVMFQGDGSVQKDDQTLTLAVGQSYLLFGQVMVYGNANAEPGLGDSAFMLSDPSTVTLAVDTPGADITSASGASYQAASAAEPSAWLLMIAGCGLVGAASRRRLLAPAGRFVRPVRE